MRYTYVVNLVKLPPVPRHCPRCGAQKPFLPSDQIRVNAQKKLLDVWLIHRCQDCGQTWNMEVFARVPRGRLDQSLYDRMLENDPELIWSLALDRPLHERCGAKLSPDALEYAIEGEKLPPGSLKEPVELFIVCKVSPGIRLSKLIREITGFSARDFAMMVSSGLISSPDAKDLLKARMGTRCTVRLLPG